MCEIPVQSRSRKRKNLLIGLLVIALISGFQIACNCAAYRATVIAVRILQEPPGLPSGTVSKEEDSIQDTRETIRGNLAIEMVVFLTALGCLWELRRPNTPTRAGIGVSEAI
jgi:hypothetical protein